MTPFGDFLGALARPVEGRNRRISSNEQPNWNDGNFDMTPLPPGETLELPVLRGPGVIRHLWFTSHAGGVNELNALSLRIYWDDRPEPGVEAPLGDFFAVGQGTVATVESLPVQVSPTGSLTCYWHMPFARSARIVIRNDNPDRTTGLYWQVDWVELDELPPDTPYFHAHYRQEYPAVMGRDYLLADLRGCGHYVGTVLGVTLAQDGWFGEGDDFFYIDGEEIPSLQGTGTEDYFNDAWGFRPRTGTWFGQPRWQGDGAGDSGVCYRWHVPDPVSFRTSLTVTLEHKGNLADSVDGWYIERPDFWSSVAFWYQTGEPAPREPLPGWPERCVPWEQYHLVRAYRTAHATEGPLSVRTEGFFGGRPALAWSPSEAGARLSIPFTPAQSGRSAVRVMTFAHPGGGRFLLGVEGQGTAVEVDLDASEFCQKDLLIGTCALEGGPQTLTVRALSAGTFCGELLRVLPLPPEATRAKKTYEAHFIRLGIGRAAYAYRLAYGNLPDTLEELVDCGIMPGRYLQDENGEPLRAHREGEGLRVEAAAWSHRFLGLDARR